MIAIVCGGRDYADIARVKLILDAAVVKLGLSIIIEGAATGADTLAREWALAGNEVSVIELPANWDLGKSAGPARNQMMLTMLLRSDGDKAVIAFPGGTGTEHMKKIARTAKVRVIEV